MNKNLAIQKFGTELSKYVWKFKEPKLRFQTTWKIYKKAASYDPASNHLNLYLWEQYFYL